MTEFEGVFPALAQALTKRGYTELTPVQQAMLAPEITDADTLVSAQTGSGKTVAFGMAIAPTLLGDAERFTYAEAPTALIVAPTRELALQVKREFEWLYQMTGVSMASCVGGMDMRTERQALQRGAHIVVGTPGRLRDHIERGSFNTKALKAVVLDEADEMLDLGFRDDLEYILDSSPKDRRTLMFSATVPRSIETLAKRFQRNAVRIATTTAQSQHLDIDYRGLTVAPNDRDNAIINVLRYYDAKNALVFCATRLTVKHMTSRLANRGFSVVALSGELSQNERTHALQAMRDGRARVCVATDVAARGIDLPNLELVIHADIPKSPETLLHRSGRTGRAGRKGVCTLIVPHNWRRRTERLLSSAKIEATWAKPPSAEDIQIRDHERLLSDPMLSEPLSDLEKTFAEELLARHSVENIAAAFIRQHFAGQAAPEELLDVAQSDSRGDSDAAPHARQREDFKESVWFSLSVGRDQNAEPRWLLPMLCRAGHITKNDIGAIRIQGRISYFELTPGSVDQFLTALGAGGKIEENINVKRLDGPPSMIEDRSDGPEKGNFKKRKSFSSDKPRGRRDSKPERNFQEPDIAPDGEKLDWKKSEDKKPEWKKPPGKKPEGRKPDGKPQDGKSPWGKSDKKPTGKKFSPNRGKADGKPGSKPGGKPGKLSLSGSAPLKRKKPKKS